MQKKGRLELTWAGKSYETESFEPRLLVEDKEKSYGDDSPNMLIHGDNLLALKALELDYMEAVQCIYIDPPFNTGGRIDASGQEIGYDDGLEHSIWLDMMYVRLKLLRNLLNPTGLIYVHIDDKEQAYLKVIMDEIFGRKNFVQMIAVKRASPAGFKVINPGPLTVTDYILLYAKDKTLMKYIPQRIPVGYDENYNLIINNPNDDPENWSFSKLVDLLYEQYGFKSWKDASNAWGTNWKTVRNSLLGDVALKNADRVVSVRDPHKPSQLIKEKMIESKSNGGKVIEIKRDGMRPIYIFEGGSLSFYKDKLRQIDGELTPTEVLTDFWADINFAGMAKEGAVQFKNSKKPEKLIKRILELSTEEGDLVLDSFAGSATTAAVSLKMKRKFITIELAPHCYSHCLPRLMSVVDGEQSGISKAVNWNGGGGFKFYELAPSLLVKNDKLPIYQINPSYTFEMLCEAICKIEGFRYKPQDVFHGHSSEKRFIHITTEFINARYIKSVSARLAEGQSLLIYGTKIQSDMVLPDNIEVKKIPKDLLEKCDFESEVQ